MRKRRGSTLKKFRLVCFLLGGGRYRVRIGVRIEGLSSGVRIEGLVS